MSDWAAGYVSEVGYTYGYYRELSPAMLSLALLSKGVDADLDKPLRYLELGFGQGLSLNIHAAACPGEYWGTDFNPAQAANAKESADACGSNARILDASFQELAARDDLPEFDVMALHGIWSWISDENRAAIVDLTRRKLAIGGVFYISYNSTPGWSAAMPLRHLMSLHANFAGSDANGITANIDNALGFVQRAIDSGAYYFRINPTVVEKLKGITDQNRNYLAHEYFNKDWQPMAFSEVAERLEPAKLQFAASAYLTDQLDEVCLTQEGRQFLNEITHPLLRESVRDYFTNQQFRRDIFIKGRRPLSQMQRVERFRNLKVVLTTFAPDVPMRLSGPIGKFTLQESIYKPLFEILAENNYAPKQLKQIEVHPLWKQQPLGLLIQAVQILTGAGHLHPVREQGENSAAKELTTKLNFHLCRRARDGADIDHLASPVIGAGLPVTRFQQLFLIAAGAGQKTPEEWAGFAWGTIAAQGQRLTKEGRRLDSPEENIAELTAEAKAFAEKRIPILQALKMA